MLSYETLNTLIGLGTIILEIGTIALIVLLFLRKRSDTAREISVLAANSGLLIGLLLTIGGLFGSLYYSEVLGFVPCGLCWTIRIFMYSQVFLFATALIKKDQRIADYSIVLSGAGFIVGVYQSYLQMGGADLLPCPASPEAANCAERILFEFGHVTFPWAGAVVFLFLIVLMLHVRARAQ